MFNTSHGAPVTEETKVQGDQEMTETEQKEQSQPRIQDVQEDASRFVRTCLWPWEKDNQALNPSLSLGPGIAHPQDLSSWLPSL